jgi:hypothetical protein
MEIKHISNNKFEINHKGKIIKVTILNLFKSLEGYANFLYELRYDEMTLTNYYSIFCEFNIDINNTFKFKNNDTSYTNSLELYKDELVKYIFKNKEFFIENYS